ncbi:MAG: DUF5723 family protein [bacterium]
MLIFFLFLCLSPFSRIVSASAHHLSLGFNPAGLPDKGDGAFLESMAFGGSSAMPYLSIISDQWDGPFSPKNTNNLDSLWRVETGLIHHGWRLACFYRGELFLEANRDTVDILRKINLKQTLPAGKRYDIDLRSTGFSASGIELSKGMVLRDIHDGLAMGFTVRYLRGEKIQDGRIEGIVIPSDSKSYDLNLFIDYVYDENFIYEREKTRPGTGHGFSLDFGLTWVIGQNFSGQLLLRDLGGRIYWKDVPYTTANASSEVKVYDPDGYQEYRPSIKGYEGYKDYVQSIPLKIDVAFSYHRGPFTLTPAASCFENRQLIWINLDYQAIGAFALRAGYNFNYQALSLGLSYRKCSFDIYGTKPDVNRTNVLGLSLSLGY